MNLTATNMWILLITNINIPKHNISSHSCANLHSSRSKCPSIHVPISIQVSGRIVSLFFNVVCTNKTITVPTTKNKDTAQ